MDVEGRVKHSPTKSTVVQNLKKLVSLNKDDLENGDVPLCLTPEVLVILNHGFEHLGDMRNGGNKFYNDLDFLKRALNSTRYLRLSHGGTATIQAPVDLGVFNHLSQLDIKRIPIHWIVGLNRFQDRLTLIRMCRSLNFLEDLLGVNSRSNSLSLAWSKLKKLYLSNNFIKTLDESLNLVPALEVLDLSRNYLKQTDHFLECLTELVHLNISYNSLTTIPTFADSSLLKLQTLVLRANHIEHIHGIERLKHLETLDLTSNILCDHAVLIPLYSITTLTQLYLDDNPLSCNPRHRILTASILSSTVIKQLSLDDQKFTETERQQAASLRVVLRPSAEGGHEAPVADSASTRSVGRRVKANDVNNIEEIPQPDDHIDGPVSTVLPSVNNSDSPRPSPKSSLQLSKVKTKADTMREEFGDEWLQSFNGHKVSTDSKTTEDKMASDSGLGKYNDSMHDAENKHGNPCETESGETKENDVTAGEGSSNPYATDPSATDNESTHSVEEAVGSELDMHYDPFIVKLPVIDAEEFLLSFTEKQIIEKSIEGILTEMLELSALLEVRHVELDGRQMVRCKFDYFRKDRRERCYVMEDLNDAMRLVDILQPIAASTQSSRKSTGVSECLKCGKQFIVKKSVKNGSSMDCMHCGSDMVMELCPTRSTQSTPFGSFSSSNLSTSPKHSVKPVTDQSNIHVGSMSNNSVYMSLDEGDSSPTSKQPIVDRHPHGDGTAEWTSKSTGDWVSPADSLQIDSEEEIATGSPSPKASAAPTPDSLSYKSIGNDSISDSSLYAENHQMDDHIKQDSLTGFKFDPTNLSYIDHRLKLHLTVSYFQDHEQPACTVRCKCVEYTRPEEYPAVLQLTSSHFYILRIHSARSRGAETTAQLELLERRPLSDICHIEIGLSHQNIRVEFDRSGYCLLIRDQRVGQFLHASFSMLLRNSSFSEQSKLKSIGKINQEYYQQISRCLPKFHVHEEDAQAVYFVSGFLRVSTDNSYNLDSLDGCQPVSLVAHDCNLYVVKETYYLPFTRSRIHTGQSYLSLESIIHIHDVVSLSINRERSEVDVVEGFEQQTPNTHQFVFWSSASLSYFTEAIQSLWKDIYNVDLEVKVKV
ncbi:serine/threonine-protein kinase 11-interacting protein-like isoform X2 [Watersipora subatra]|uniref:serine/threonine-protein kinase 11-interacting protein-like isoform X2 n=1 Tax=Watersipora subatra TaxID=2589382 RepID=UPI00355AFAA0